MRLSRGGWGALMVGAIVAIAASMGCQGGGAPPIQQGEPGSAAWASGTVSCMADSDCNQGEACSAGLCQMKRCGEPNYKSVPPLGTFGYFQRNAELIAASATSVDGFNPKGAAISRPGIPATWSPSARVVDIAGGNLLSTRPEVFALALAGSDALVVQASTQIRLELGFVPIAVATGDVDADGRDDIVATDSSGNFAICDATKVACTRYSLGTGGVVDLTVGDVDADGYAEPVFLLGGRIAVYNTDAKRTGQDQVVFLPTEKTLTRISAGDLDGDGVAEIVGIAVRTSGGLPKDEPDTVNLFTVQGTALTLRTSAEVTSGSLDVTVGSFGGKKPEIGVLGASNSIEMFVFTGEGTPKPGAAPGSPEAPLVSGTLTSEYKTTLPTSTPATRLASADVDGDSPTRRLVGQPRLVPGTVVPIAALTLPPYSRSHSDGVSSVSLGDTKTKSNTTSNTLILRAGVEVAIGGGLGPIVSAEVTAHIALESWRSKEFATTISIGSSYEVEAHPESDGYDGGAVVVGCGCYHQYNYVIEDPAAHLGPGKDGSVASVFVPVGGQTSLWSTRRYNALAQALGGKLPNIKIPVELGQVASYASKPMSLQGTVIPENDLVFTNPPTFRVSDVATVNFELEVSKEETNSGSLYTEVGATVEVGLFGVSVTGELDVSIGHGYEISVGETATFSGAVPPLRNDPETPEDEFALHGYSFTPLVYRAHYTDDSNHDSAYYVMTYAVGH